MTYEKYRLPPTTYNMAEVGGRTYHLLLSEEVPHNWIFLEISYSVDEPDPGPLGILIAFTNGRIYELEGQRRTMIVAPTVWLIGVKK